MIIQNWQLIIYNKYLDEIRSLNEKINSLYFTDYSNDRSDNLKKLIFEIIKIIDDNLQNSNILAKNEIAFLYLTKSLCLDKLPEYSKIAEESASKSVLF